MYLLRCLSVGYSVLSVLQDFFRLIPVDEVPRDMMEYFYLGYRVRADDEVEESGVNILSGYARYEWETFRRTGEQQHLFRIPRALAWDDADVSIDFATACSLMRCVVELWNQVASELWLGDGGWTFEIM